MRKNYIEYSKDIIYGATKYPFGLLKPCGILHRFPTNTVGIYQKYFYYELLRFGFRNTIWQLVFPGQIGGLIRTIPVQPDGVDEAHVRFYDYHRHYHHCYSYSLS